MYSAFFSHPPIKNKEGDLCEQNLFGVGIDGVHTLYFSSETATWNHFILYMHISLGGLFNICENGGGAPYTL